MLEPTARTPGDRGYCSFVRLETRGWHKGLDRQTCESMPATNLPASSLLAVLVPDPVVLGLTLTCSRHESVQASMASSVRPKRCRQPPPISSSGV